MQMWNGNMVFRADIKESERITARWEESNKLDDDFAVLNVSYFGPRPHRKAQTTGNLASCDLIAPPPINDTWKSPAPVFVMTRHFIRSYKKAERKLFVKMIPKRVGCVLFYQPATVRTTAVLDARARANVLIILYHPVCLSWLTCAVIHHYTKNPSFQGVWVITLCCSHKVWLRQTRWHEPLSLIRRPSLSWAADDMILRTKNKWQ